MNKKNQINFIHSLPLAYQLSQVPSQRQQSEEVFLLVFDHNKKTLADPFARLPQGAMVAPQMAEFNLLLT